MAKTGAVKKSTPLSHNLVIGLSASLALLLSAGLFCLICWYMPKRKHKLHMKFDYDYELRKKERAAEEDLYYKR